MATRIRGRGASKPDPDGQQQRELERAAVSAGLQDESGFSKDVLDFLADTDLDPASKEKFMSLLSRDWVLANLSEAGYNELKWELRHLKNVFYDMHPDHDSLVVGEIRAAINGDPADTLKPLSDDDKREVEQLFRTIRLRLTRSKGMRQQSIIQTSISQTQVNRAEGEGNNGLLSKIRR